MQREGVITLSSLRASSDKVGVDDGFLVFHCLMLIVTEVEVIPLLHSKAAQSTYTNCD